MTTEESQEATIEESQQKKRRFKTTWTWIKYFAMKWRFRVDQARAIFGLVTFAALLALGYADKIPWFQDQRFWRGEFLLTFLVLVVFLIGGYLYDRFLKLWTETTKVAIERNPYTYVPNPKELWLSRAVWLYTFMSLSQIADKLELNLENEEEMKLLLKKYYSLTPQTENFEKEVVKLSKITDIIEKKFYSLGKIADYQLLFPESEEITNDEKEKN